MTEELKDYFENTTGTGVLATGDRGGKVNAAIYGRPHIFENGEAGFIMRDRLSHANLQSSPHAVYLFIEDGPGYKGKRLYMTKLYEEKDSERVNALRRRKRPPESEQDSDMESIFLAVFKIDRILPLTLPGKRAV